MALKIHPTSSFNFSFTSFPSSFRSHFGLRGSSSSSSRVSIYTFKTLRLSELIIRRRRSRRVSVNGVSAALKPLDLNEDNVRQVLADARTEFLQIFDTSVGITGEAELVEVDGPFVKISLKGRFWHERSLVLARLGNYLKQRIPEILEVDIEDEKQLDDSPENF